MDRCKKKAREKEGESGRGRAGEKRIDRSSRNFHRNWQKISKDEEAAADDVREERGRRLEEKKRERKEAAARERSSIRETARALPVGIRCLYTFSQV